MMAKKDTNRQDKLQIDTKSVSNNGIALKLSNLAYSYTKRIWNLNTDNQENVGEVLDRVHPTFRFGFIVSAFVILFFIGWSSFAPLDSAAVANGSVVLLSSKKTVQHLEGGIITEILVKEGDMVKINQPLIKLNSSSPQAKQSLLLGQLNVAKATEGRLIAARDNLDVIEFDKSLIQNQSDEHVSKILQNQRRIYEVHNNALLGKVNILRQRIEQYNDQIAGLDAQVASVNTQIMLKKEEIDTVEKLLKKGLEKRPRFLNLKQQEAILLGQRGDYVAQISRVKDNIIETELQIDNEKHEYLKTTLDELKTVQDRIASLEEQLYASEDILSRTLVTAPQAGIVTGLQFHTIGGVVPPGAQIMDIVPQNDKLVIEARVQPIDIDVVHKGLRAKVMLSAYKSRTVPRLNGIVTDISADKFTDEKTGKDYFLSQVEIDEKELDRLSTDSIRLYPGMPAEVFIVTGERTLLDYLSDPIVGSFRRAFREQ